MLFKGPCSVHSRLAHMLMALVLLGLFVQTLRLATDRKRSPLLKDAELIPEGNASPEELYLGRLTRELGLSHEASWVAWRIQPSEQSEVWPSVTEVHLNFGAVAPKTINLASPDRMDLYAKKRMELPVPTGPKLGDVDASDFLFGISTTYARISDRDYAMIKAWARWLTDGHHHSNGASMVVVLDQANASQLDEVDRALQASGLDCWVTTTEEPMSMARRYFELTRILKTFAANLAANGQNKRWFGLVEDDVFFPSLSYLRDRLFSYNTDSQHYIGLPSEKLDWDTSENEQIQTHGGGAVLLTLSALTRIPNLPCFETESSRKTSFKSKRWDELLHTCLMKHTELQMHVLPGFYSPNDKTIDENVDSYETGQQPLLLRRYAHRHLLNINKAHLVTNVCGESCFMQRYLFKDNWVLVNGISITQYPDGVKIEHKEAHKGASTEEKKEDHQKRSNLEADEAGRDISSSLTKRLFIDDDSGSVDRATLSWSGRRNAWKLVDSAVSKDGAVWQAYLKRGKKNSARDVQQQQQQQGNSADEKDSIIVLVWEQAKSAL
ncbi:unnamed protein product [Clonostachys solani]|uniref:Glycosyltransferase family 31 protein n=1 Tax=Clonostachys solani TaxID=160281 RepID=A0A9N9Z4B3_9HYPO|nr:unnamed protein product [Clonostachys solani]